MPCKRPQQAPANICFLPDLEVVFNNPSEITRSIPTLKGCLPGTNSLFLREETT